MSGGERVNMSFFDEEKNEQTEDNNQADIPQDKISINGEEYTQEQLDRLISLGKIGVEAEEKYHTKIDKVWPKYSELSGKAKKYEEELEELRAKAQPATPALPQDEEQAIREAKDAARKLGIVTADDFEDLMAKNFKKYYQQEEEAKSLLGTVTGLEEKIDGSDGRPRFDALEVMEHMKQTGIRDPEKAYKDLHEDAIDEWKTRRLGEEKKGGYDTASGKGAGVKAPKEVRITDENFATALSETLFPNR